MVRGRELGIAVAIAFLFQTAGVWAQGTAGADSGETTRFGAMHYRSVGPHRGGRSTAGTGVPPQPYTFFIGATGGGVWKTTDAGESWTNVSDGFIEAGSIGEIRVAPSDPNVIEEKLTRN